MRRQVGPKQMQQAEKRLERFVNLDAADQRAEKKFLGSLRADYTAADGSSYVRQFRDWWRWVCEYKPGDAKSEAQLDAVELSLDSILHRRNETFWRTGRPERPTIHVDIRGGGFKSEARDGLDSLAILFIHARRRLAICTCGRYFIRAHSRDGYCSTDCQAKARQESKNRWFKSPAGKRWLKENRKQPEVKVRLSAGRQGDQ